MEFDIKKYLNGGVKNIVSKYSGHYIAGSSDAFLSSRHAQREIFFVLQGTSRYMLNNRIYQARPGDVFLIDSWENHAFGYMPEDNELLHLWINLWSHTQMNAYLLKVGHGGQYQLVSNKIEFSPEIHNIIKTRWDALNELQEVTDETVMNYIQRPIDFVLNEIAFQIDIRQNELFNQLDSVLESLKKYIKNTNGRGCSYKKLEQISGYSSSHLAHRFREYEGYPVGEYIDKIRVLFTVKALKKGLKQKEIASELGFSSPANFWLWMQKHHDMIENEKKYNTLSNEV